MTAPERPVESAEPPNGVAAAQRRIADELGLRPHDALPTRTPAEVCLAAILGAIGWTGGARHVLEAMPHLGTIDDALGIRTVLYRLGIQTRDVGRVSLRRLRQTVPCLVVRNDGSAVAVLSVDDAGNARTIDGEARVASAQPVSRMKGRIVRVLSQRRDGDPAPQSSLGWVMQQLVRLRGEVKVIALLSLAINLLLPLTTLFVMTVYDKAIGTRSLDTLAFLVGGVLVAMLIEIRLRDVRARRLSDLGGRIDATIGVNTFNKLLHLPVALIESAPLGTQLARFRQFEIGREIFQGRLAAALLDLPFTVVFFALIFILGGVLGFIPVALAIVIVVVSAIFAPVINARSQAAGASKTHSDQMTVEIATKLQTIRGAGASDLWVARAEAAYADYVVKRYQANQASSVLQSVSQFCVTASGTGLLGLGAWRVMHGDMSIGALVAIMAVAWRVLGPIQDVLLAFGRLAQLKGTVAQIDQLMRMQPEREPQLSPVLKRRFAGGVTATGVAFRYPSRQDLTLKGVSLDVKPLEFVALCGASASGKSTLARLLMGLHQPQAGSIRYDGLDLRQLDLGEVRRTVGYLPQNSVLFHGTIAQNIRLAAPDATDAAIVDVLTRLDLAFPHPMFPQGIDTRISAELRERLSQPVYQRLLLARVFVRDWPILLLDEPATYLDREGDEAFQRLLEERRGRSTVVMITARPSHMKLCDRVVYLADGAIVAAGPPADMVPRILAQAQRAAS